MIFFSYFLSEKKSFQISRKLSPNLYGMSNLIFWEQVEKHFIVSSAEMFIQHANVL